MTAVRICSGLPFSIWLVSKNQLIKQHLENIEENSLFNEAEHEPPSLTVFKTRHLKICEGGPLHSSNEEQTPSSLPVFSLHDRKHEDGSTPPFFQKHIYKIGVLALAVAHSVTGVEKLKDFNELALALSLEPVGVSA